jgi:hypothetical protein
MATESFLIYAHEIEGDCFMRQRLPALVLIFMAPLVAELLAGTTPLGQPLVLAFLLPVYLLLYGAGALLMRELVRRSGRGWTSILLLGAAYGLIEEGFASQSLFNPSLYHAAEWGARILGINGVFTEFVIIVHVVWSAAIPILLTELLFPGQRTTPYLGRVGLVVTAICYTLGVALLWLIARVSFAAGYEAPPLLPGLALLTAVILAVVALAVLPRKRPRPTLQRNAPHPWVVFLSISVSGLIWQGGGESLWYMQPLFSVWPLVLVPALGSLLVAFGIVWLVDHWSQAQDWRGLHQLALASGAVICHILVGLLVLTQTTADRIGLALLGLAMTGLLVWLAIRMHRRAAPGELLVKKASQA